jgi:hypothetical protein
MRERERGKMAKKTKKIIDISYGRPKSCAQVKGLAPLKLLNYGNWSKTQNEQNIVFSFSTLPKFKAFFLFPEGCSVDFISY